MISWSRAICTFQSTRPVWGATAHRRSTVRAVFISIHAPRVGRDIISHRRAAAACTNFNPRAPCGARPRIGAPQCGQYSFQSTRPVWGATSSHIGGRLRLARISIHAPRVGRDRPNAARTVSHADFNPRAPCGARLAARISTAPAVAISIHAPRVGRDLVSHGYDPIGYDFNPRAPCGARPAAIASWIPRNTSFQSTRPVWGATSRTSDRDDRPAHFNPRAPCGARPTGSFTIFV